ncbi:hypothetical protein Aeqsu_0535 [Aequorivita sublithincola DSM 14238]|uniref:Uncharacterized protein n=1 Tax=Aequorivita sublithincola (strain DSM 14238 / LMG 21431 / ACAM 643 / 9-3) TaxID=746697 RepID=I3YSS9_AEQSU|nr:hypothetical protein [Aequorivita sublithincola]AFL80047.1 hypothetical protein Aeqsu_0535 [Aequorivita sublithincola DSM 14238]
MKNLWYLPLILLLTVFNSCEDEPISKADPSKVIIVNSELYNLIQKACSNDFENQITCIDFNYAFTLVVYDENMEVFAYQIINSDIEFSDFLDALEEGKSIGLSYPISSVLNNGEPYVINNNDELKDAINKCLQADTITTCNNILTETSCMWKIDHLAGPNSEYEGSYFEVTNFGNAGLYFQDHSFGGTWITYFIEEELHLNIFLTGDANVIDDWNFDWKVVSFDETQMEITNGTDSYRLLKDCYEPCRKFLFEECETESNSGSAIFDLESYFDCFFPLTGIPDPATVAASYYETYDDMLAGTNPIVNIMYENTVNPQVIYIRFEDVNTGEPVAYLPIILKAINC